ncbi:MAG: hypothetical protein IJV80_02290, partial [Clostridia bacterium]|nr:hypothetical protein [Clostridia bacterium]
MENYAKVILYTYSKMEEMDADLKEHIRFKAFTSYDYRRSTEAIAEYIAEQVISRRTLCELKDKIQKALSSLSSEEQLLLELRYFGGLEKVVHTVRGCLRRSDEPTVREKKVCERLSLKRIWSERSYFRKQKALLEKIEKKLQSVGLSETLFWEKY